MHFMRFLLLFIGLFFVIPGGGSPVGQPAFQLNTFSDKEIPDQLQGCGDSYYLKAADRKTQKNFICCSNDACAMVSINHKIVLLVKSFQFDGYVTQGYTLTIKNGPMKTMGDEYYQMKATLTLKLGKKIIWTAVLLGDGGC
jgi:hypothetical protein